jgi:hypothetical protein
VIVYDNHIAWDRRSKKAKAEHAVLTVRDNQTPSVYPGSAPSKEQVENSFKEFERIAQDLYKTVKDKRLQYLFSVKEVDDRRRRYYSNLVDEKTDREKIEILRVIVGYKPITHYDSKNESGVESADAVFRDASSDYKRTRAKLADRNKVLRDNDEAGAVMDLPSTYESSAPGAFTGSKEILQWELYHFRLYVPHLLKWRHKQWYLDGRGEILPLFKDSLEENRTRFARLKSLCEAAGVKWPAEEDWRDLKALFDIAL